MDNWRLIHRFYRQELGYRGNSDRPSAGPYIFIEKEVARSCFPRLSQDRKNDTVPILCEIEGDNNPILLPFVYHNSRIVENRINGREEYRLYVADLKARFSEMIVPGKVIEIVPVEIGLEGDLKIRIATLAEDHPDSRRFAGRSNNRLERLYGKPIPTRPLLTEEAKAPGSISETVLKKLLDLEIIVPPGRRHGQSTVSALRDAAFRKVVIGAYNHNCALTGKTMGGAGLFCVEAAHIVPVSDGGSDNPRNGIPLVRDLHWAFDRGFFTFDRAGGVLVHPLLSVNSLWPKLLEYKICMPKDERLKPDPSALEWHRRNIFGRFAGATQ